MKIRGLKKVLLAVVFTTLTIALSGCSGDKAGDHSSQITIGIPQDLDNLDPHDAVAAGTKEVLFNVFEGLVKPDSTGDLIPAVAESYEATEGGKVYTFHLRNGIKFHDGSKVTVDDVVYSLNKCADTADGDALVPALTAIESIDTPNDETIVITLADADPDFLAYLTTAITPAANAAKEDTDPIGTGPYKYVSWSPQESFTIEKFDEYWGEPAGIANVTFKICANADTIVTDLEGGSIDMFARVTSDQAKQLEKAGGFQILEGTMNLVQALYLNNAVEPLNDVRVRQALSYAVNRQEVLDFVSDGRGTVIGSSMFPSFGKYYLPELADVYEQDTQKAKDLLAEAGYPDGFPLTITVASNYQQHVDTAQVIQQQLQAIGIDAQIELVEWDTWLSEVYSGRNYESTVVGVDASSLTANALLSRFRSDAHNNFVNFNSAAYDEAYAAAQTTTNDEERTAFYKECETILTNEAANVYIQDLPEFVALSDKYTGYEFYPLYVQDVAKLRLVEAK